MKYYINTLYSRMQKKLNKVHFELINDRSFWKENNYSINDEGNNNNNRINKSFIK